MLLLSCNKPDQEELSPDLEALLNAIDATTALNQGLSAGEKEDLLVFQPFQNPPEERSRQKELITKLDVQFAANQVYRSIVYEDTTVSGEPEETKIRENVEVYHRSYNGQLVGNTWRIKPGDHLQVNVKNLLGMARGDCNPLNGSHNHGDDINEIDSARFNTTNLHVHGFHVSPEGHSDNVFAEIEPGCSFQNRYDLPKDHATGTFWYHGHVHGSTAIQVASGMAGAIIIEGGLDTIPEIKAMAEKIFVMQQMPFMYDSRKKRYDIPFDEDTTGNFGPGRWQRNAGKNGWRTTINGQAIPVLTMAPNEVQRWRFIHAGVRETVNLSVYDREENGGQRKLVSRNLHAIAEDGIAYGYREAVTNKLLQPGYRADFLFQAPDKTGDTLYVMDAASEVLGNLDSIRRSESPKLLAMIVLAKKGGEIAARLPSQKSLKGLAPYPSLQDVETTVANETMRFNIEPNGKNTKFMIDGVPFDPKNVRQLQLDAVQDWELSSGLGSHPFHIHVNHFQIVDKYVKTCVRENKQGECVQKEWVHVKPAPVWKDTYFVRSDEITTIRTVYKDFTGKFVIHCHILDHEDQGMMQSVEIVEKLPASSKVSSYTEGITVCSPEEKSVKVVPPD
ncbi:MAG: multicopper oxidase domain-containing protein [Roseivirga sp.]